MRYFLGLNLEPAIKLAIDDWRHKALPKFQFPVTASNLHITLVFLGNVNHKALEQLTARIDAITASPFSLHLNQLGYWSKPRVLWLGAQTVDDNMYALVENLTQAANQCGMNIPKQPYIPHVSLARKLNSNPAAAIIEPNFACDFDQIHLYESVSGSNGVQYLIRDSWSL